MAVAGDVDLTKPPVEEAPVDLLRQPNQRVVHVDDLLQSLPH
jgi:hypothetical protein